MVSGEGSNLQALLDAEAAGVLGARIVAVLSDRPGARALERARTAGKPAVLLEPDPPGDTGRAAWDRATLRELDRWRPDLVVLAGYMRILGPSVVAAYRHRIMNVHPSLLPAFPGRHAVRQALAHGVKVTGCTVHFVDEGVDTGPIILQAAVEVREEDDEASLTRRIQQEEHRIYPLAVWLFANGRLEVEGRRVRVRGPVPERLPAPVDEIVG
ncbi:MAG: phosphoribosylglycinamide formyltransferase [Bacillota bacterium]|nr:MAG: phosphoribosylglycinamide formyltransferase [Bacillota bacterium]